MAKDKVIPVETAGAAVTGDVDLKTKLDAANAALEEANKKLAKAGVSDEIDALVRQKMRLGLSREDALVVARRQTLHDAALKLPDATPDQKQSKEQAIIAAACAE